MCECKLMLFCAVVLYNVILVTPFNIDKFNYAAYKSDGGSMFGFTVAVHKDGGNRGWVLVGAPEARSSYHDPRFRGGAVYRCRTDADDVCQEIPFSRESYNRFGNKVLDDKSQQWFGATLSASPHTNGRIVACAPRYVWYTKYLNRKDPVGTCFVADGNFQNAEEYSPCRTMNWGYHRQGFCQAGFSAAISGSGDRLYVGAPGSYFWQGQLYSIDAHARFNFTPGIYGYRGYGAKGSVYQQSLETREAVFSTREGDHVDYDTYMGYSMVVGDFLDGEEYEGIAVGMPKGNNLKGKVLLYSWDLKNYKNLTASKQIGSYFGYSITAADVNGDKRLDIIVGAPMHTEANNDNKYDVGRVYVFHQSSDPDSFAKYSFIDGTTSKSRFGHAVSSLGDLNQDGCDDFAVGAPYAGSDGRGAVYIYYGSKQGIRKKSEQVIYAKDIETNIPLQTFGFSISGGMDLDGNDYPDMAVGAYLSDTAFFFRSQPVVIVDAYVQYRTAKKQIDIKETNCHMPDGLEAICIDVDFCMKYTGKGIPQELYFNVEYFLDGKKPNTSRMGFFTRKTHQFVDTLLLYKDRQNCKMEKIYIKSDMRDKLTPLEAEMKYSLIDESSFSGKIRDPGSHLRPALDLNSPPSRKDSITVQKNCGPDNICIPDLDVSIESNVKKYLSGSGTNLEFDVIVSNLGEDAFETMLGMRYSKDINFNKVVVKSNMPGILCSPVNATFLSCDIGNPLPGKKIAMFKIVLQPPTKEDVVPPSYEFDVFVNSTNPEQGSTMANNQKHISIDIWIDASLEMRGDSYPPTVYYNQSFDTSGEIIRENDIGPQVTHVYYVRNSGPATIQEAEVFILWPLRTLGGEDLLYLLDEPHTKGNVKCDPGMANYKSYLVNYHVDSIWDRLRIDTSSVEDTIVAGKLAGSETIEKGAGTSSGPGVVNRNNTDEKFEGNTSINSSSVTEHHNASSNINSFGTVNANGEFVHTEARSYTVWRNGEPHTTWQNVTTIRDANGKILKTFTNPSSVTESHNNASSNVNSFGTMNANGEFVHTEARSYTVWRNGEPHTTWENVTTIRDAKGKILKTLHSNDNTGQSSGGSFTQGSFGTTGDRHSVDRGSSGIAWQTTSQEEQARAEQQRRILEQERLSREQKRREEYERKKQEEAWQVRQLEERRLQEEARRKQQSGYGQGGITYNEDNHRQAAGWDRSSTGQVFETEEERRRFYEEERRRQEASRRQGGVQESGAHGRGQIEQHFVNRGRLSGGGRHHVLTGYYDENGLYHNYSGNPQGEVVFNRTYTVETTDTIPIDLSGGQSGQHLDFGETALGSGFTVQTLDLGNSASESSLSGGYGAGSETSGSSGGFREQLYGQHQGSHQSGSSSSSGGSYSQDWQVEGGFSQRGQIPPTIVHNTVERDNVPTDRPNPKSRSRGKRELDPYEEIQALVKCNATRCNYIRCVVGTLTKDKEVAIALRSRLNLREVNNITSSQAIQISSMIVGKISKLNMRSQDGQLLKEHEVFTEVPAKGPELVPEVAPLWIYVVSAVAGVVMLLLLIWILSKCGFFKRNRPSSAAERQPLNRNGYHSGDEAL
ncbi:integrin alpha-PS2 isoform X3 [Anoplophora glabripennis]|uniref:integrin alpha-PS2 isoform X3 n=1 Tax=Anoplophora glabripennis TaxID=217634 RepID=UPI0008751EA6|nr:integrin alpha-PS2 isoform X3 [Anoplophora glabripennis]